MMPVRGAPVGPSKNATRQPRSWQYARSASLLAVGITEHTFYNWVARGGDAKSRPCQEFFQSMRQSIAL